MFGILQLLAYYIYLHIADVEELPKNQTMSWQIEINLNKPTFIESFIIFIKVRDKPILENNWRLI